MRTLQWVETRWGMDCASSFWLLLAQDISMQSTPTVEKICGHEQPVTVIGTSLLFSNCIQMLMEIELRYDAFRLSFKAAQLVIVISNEKWIFRITCAFFYLTELNEKLRQSDVTHDLYFQNVCKTKLSLFVV